MRQLLDSLQERAKELSCLYRIDEILADADLPLEEAAQLLVDALPSGWMYPEICCARLSVRDLTAISCGCFAETSWFLKSPITEDDEAVGELVVFYREEKPVADEGPFLREERKLIDAVAERISHFVTRKKLRSLHRHLSSALETEAEARRRGEWGIVLEFLRGTDLPLLRRITRRMINYLGLLGIPDAAPLLQTFTAGYSSSPTDDNAPLRRSALQDVAPLSEETFRIAAKHLPEDELVGSVRGWIEEERSGPLIEILEDPARALPEILEAIDRHRIQVGETKNLPAAFQRSLGTALLRRLFSDDSTFISIASKFVSLEDCYDLVDKVIYPPQSHGKLGGKSGGLFLASEILRHAPSSSDVLRQVRFPKTWYISSDGSMEFVRHNSLRNLYVTKYMGVEGVRQEYPHLVHLLKNSAFPPELTRGLALALDDFGDRPLIVRSSSLLEDRLGSSFAGKYKSLFLANVGTRKERILALQDAIAEVYASMFGPDPIEYRAERNLLDAHEEMGVLIQEVVGTSLGRYFLPAFSGVAFSHNEYRWSERIERQDGLVRLVPGLGTRAVDRVGDDYPVLLAPGKPGLRVNVTLDEVARYSPRWIDAIDLETGSVETLSLSRLLRDHGAEYPIIQQIVSIADGDRIRKPTGLELDFEAASPIATFEGLISDSIFPARMKELLQVLEREIGSPVDLEFASDGQDLYLLQCRAQSHSEEFSPSPIPRNLPRERVLFSAHRNISNGRVPDISHVVYVDPDEYSKIVDLEDLVRVGRVIGKLNRLLPRRRFALLGPGRWGSRGDVKLGVRVTYADISNTGLLIEIARLSGDFRPEPSFGTHFFQDLVEADIRYVPLYPDDTQGLLDELFLRRAKNLLPELLPEDEHLSEVVRVVDVRKERDGRILRVLLNADLDEAMGVFDYPHEREEAVASPGDQLSEAPEDAAWRWRIQMAERLATDIDLARFGVQAIYLIGSVKNGTSGPGSDIDLLIHDNGPGEEREALGLWLDGWSRSLAEMNYLRTGYSSDGLLDVHYLTDEDIAKRTSFAVKIGAITDAARLLVEDSDASDVY